MALRRAHYFQHVSFETPGTLPEWLAAHDFTVSATRFDVPGAVMPPAEEFDLLIVMGGPMGVHDEGRYPWLRAEKELIRQAIDSGRHVLGICLGAQLVAHVLGAGVFSHAHREIGWHPVAWSAEALALPMFSGFKASMEAFHWHGDTFDIPPGATHLATSGACRNQAFLYRKRVLGLQFHLEISEQGARDLITHCGHELVPSPTIQTAEQLLEQPERFDRCHATLAKLLHQWL